MVLNREFGLKINAESFQRPSDKTSNSRVKTVQLCFHEKNTIENLLHLLECIELKRFLEETSETSTKKFLPLHFSSSSCWQWKCHQMQLSLEFLGLQGYYIT